jgi:preprotein translocase subunit Sss1
LAYRPGDEEFIKELKRVGDGMVDMRQREVSVLELRSSILKQQRDLLEEQRGLRKTIEELTDVIMMQRCPTERLCPVDPQGFPQTYVPPSSRDLLRVE